MGDPAAARMPQRQRTAAVGDLNRCQQVIPHCAGGRGVQHPHGNRTVVRGSPGRHPLAVVHHPVPVAGFVRDTGQGTVPEPDRVLRTDPGLPEDPVDVPGIVEVRGPHGCLVPAHVRVHPLEPGEPSVAHRRARVEIGAAHQHVAPVGIAGIQVQRDDLAAFLGGHLVILTDREKQPALRIEGQSAVAEPSASGGQGAGGPPVPDPQPLGEIVAPRHQGVSHRVGTPAVLHHPGTHVEPGGDLGDPALPPTPHGHPAVLGGDPRQPEHPVPADPYLADGVHALEGLVNGHSLHGHSL